MKGTCTVALIGLRDHIRFANPRRPTTFAPYRTLIRLPDGGTLGLDVCPPTSSEQAHNLPADTPIIVVQHGLTGGSHEPYIRSVLAGACAPKSQGGLGFRAVVINFRACKYERACTPTHLCCFLADTVRMVRRCWRASHKPSSKHPRAACQLFDLPPRRRSFRSDSDHVTSQSVLQRGSHW